MAFLKLAFTPGINKENTPYATEGGWEDSDKIRFRAGTPEKIKGWARYTDEVLLGVPRAIHVWRTLAGAIYSVYATHRKVYVETGESFVDITPVRETQALTDPFSVTDGSAVVTVTDTSHGAISGAFVTLSGATATGGISADALNQEHELTFIDADSYTITVTESATSTTTGGGSVSAAYQINPGAQNQIYAYGFGSGEWGASTWGTPRTDSAVTLAPRTWSVANWGEDLIINPTEGSVYVWDATFPANRAAIISTAPTKVVRIIVTEDRHLVCFGVNTPGAPDSDLDRLAIRWASQEDYSIWAPKITNTAGEQILPAGTRIISASRSEGQNLVWTDQNVHGMQYLGPPYTFGFQQIGATNGLIGPNAHVAYNNEVYWMGEGAFYRYSSGVEPIPCSVQRFVFDNLTDTQRDKVFASVNREANEVFWFYPTKSVEPTKLTSAISAADTSLLVHTTAGFPPTGDLLLGDERVTYTSKTDTRFEGCVRGAAGTAASAHEARSDVFPSGLGEPMEPCRYVSYNLVESVWSVGRLERTAWVHRGALKQPRATTAAGRIFDHETTDSAAGDPLVAYVQSSEFDLGDGESLMFVGQLLPDFTLVGGDIELRMYTRYYPLSSQVIETVGTVTPTTNKLDTRIRARQMALRIESTNSDVWWKSGALRLDVRTDGKR